TLGLCCLGTKFFFRLRLLFTRDVDRDMAIMTTLLVRTSLRSRTQTLPALCRAHINKARLYPQIVRIDRDVVLLGLVGRICDRRVQTLSDRVRSALVRELKNSECTRNILAADHIDHK